MIDRGEVRADARVAALLPVIGPLGDVTLSQLATHTSGPPTQLPTPGQVGRNYWAGLTAGNVNDREVTWHNGGTGGFTAVLGIDRERRCGDPVRPAGANEHHHPDRFRAAGPDRGLRLVIAIVLWLVAAVCVAVFVARAWSLRPWTAKGRGTLVRSGVDAVVALAVVRALAPPPGPGVWLWVAAAVAAVAGAAGV